MVPLSVTAKPTPKYEAMVQRIHDVVLAHHIKLGGLQAWKDRPGFTFFQAPGETALLRLGAQVNLEVTRPPGSRPGPRCHPRRRH